MEHIQKPINSEKNITLKNPEEEKEVARSLVSISILLYERQVSAGKVNEVLTKWGHLILGRMGLPLSRKCQKNCSSVITLIAELNLKELKKITTDISQIEGVSIKNTLLP